jgi:hypothetical protein
MVFTFNVSSKDIFSVLLIVIFIKDQFSNSSVNEKNLYWFNLQYGLFI